MTGRLFDLHSPTVDPDELERLRATNVAPALRARSSDPSTSDASMAEMDPDQVAASAAFAIDLHRRHGPLADWQFKEHWDREYPHPCSPHLYRQARSVARDQGLIRETGETRVNPTTGRRQTVWEAHTGAPLVIEQCPTCGHIIRKKARLEAEGEGTG